MTVGVGDTFVVPISIADAVDLTSWQFDLAFDPAVVKANSMTEGPFMSAFGATLFIPPLIIDNVSGLISGAADFYIDLPPNPSGAGILANIEFTALALGVSQLTFSSVFLNLSSEGFDILNGRITVVGPQPPPPPPPIPEPTAVVLLTGGFLLFATRRAHRQG